MNRSPIRIIGGRGYLGGVITHHLECGDKTFSVEKFFEVMEEFSDEMFGSVFNNSDVVFLTSINDLEITEQKRSVCIDSNISKLFKFLDRVIRLNIYLNSFVFTSTASFYDFSSRVAVESTPVVPRSFYEWSKLACESLCRTVWESNQDTFGRIIIFRLANIYGYSNNNPIGKNRGFLNHLVRELVEGGVVNLYNQGHIFRDFIHCMDVARSIVKSVGINQDSFEIYNCGSGYLTSFYEMAEVVCENLNLPFDKHVNLVQNGVHGSDLRNYSVNSEKLARHLSFRPQISVEKGILELIRSS